MTWWAWLLVFAGLGLASLAVLGGLSWRLWRQVRALGREVGATLDRLNTVAAEMDRVTGRQEVRR